MPALKKQRIDLRLTDEDKTMIEEAAAMTNQTITQFMVNSASERAAEVIEQHRRLVLNEASWIQRRPVLIASRLKSSSALTIVSSAAQVSSMIRP
jgi:Uncharacterized protein conserved in bacteria